MIEIHVHKHEYQTIYKIQRWSSLQELEAQLNETVSKNEWRVDSHRLDAGEAGWTIYSKTKVIDAPLLERFICVAEVYRSINAHLPYTDEGLHQAGQAIDADIKKAVGMAGAPADLER